MKKKLKEFFFLHLNEVDKKRLRRFNFLCFFKEYQKKVEMQNAYNVFTKIR